MFHTLRATLTLNRFLACLVPLVTASCGDDGRIAMPTAPTVVQNVPAAVPLRGSVQDPAGRWLVGATVEALDGPSTGTKAVVGGDGIFNFTGLFDLTTRFRATHEGHETLIDTPRCSVPNCERGARPWMLFYLRPLAAPLDLSGNFTLTLTASASCATLPADARTRCYPVTITKRFRENTADLMGFDMELRSTGVLASLRRQSIGVAANYISLYLWRGEGELPAIAEDLGDNRYVSFTGETRATLSPGNLSTIELVFLGSIDVVTLRQPMDTTYFVRPSDLVAKEECAAKEHSLTLRRS